MVKLSIIMGIYQCEDTLKESLDSLLNQTFQDFEIILCDDGSNDRTHDIAQEYANTFPNKIILIRNPLNKGLAHSLNRCLNHAQGEYIARMDADDRSTRTRLEEQLNFLERHPYFAMVGSTALLFNENKIWGYRTVVEFPTKQDFLFSSPFIHPTIIIRRTILKELGGYSVSKRTTRSEDYDLFMRLYIRGYRGYNIQSPLLHYRENEKTYKRRAYTYRFGEAYIRYRGYKQLELLPKGYLYVLKPLIIGLLPQPLLMILRSEKKQLKERYQQK